MSNERNEFDQGRNSAGTWLADGSTQAKRDGLLYGAVEKQRREQLDLHKQTVRENRAHEERIAALLEADKAERSREQAQQRDEDEQHELYRYGVQLDVESICGALPRLSCRVASGNAGAFEVGAHWFVAKAAENLLSGDDLSRGQVILVERALANSPADMGDEPRAPRQLLTLATAIYALRARLADAGVVMPIYQLFDDETTAMNQPDVEAPLKIDYCSHSPPPSWMPTSPTGQIAWAENSERDRDRSFFVLRFDLERINQRMQGFDSDPELLALIESACADIKTAAAEGFGVNDLPFYRWARYEGAAPAGVLTKFLESPAATVLFLQLHGPLLSQMGAGGSASELLEAIKRPTLDLLTGRGAVEAEAEALRAWSTASESTLPPAGSVRHDFNGLEFGELGIELSRANAVAGTAAADVAKAVARAIGPDALGTIESLRGSAAKAALLARLLPELARVKLDFEQSASRGGTLKTLVALKLSRMVGVMTRPVPIVREQALKEAWIRVMWLAAITFGMAAWRGTAEHMLALLALCGVANVAGAAWIFVHANQISVPKVVDKDLNGRLAMLRLFLEGDRTGSDKQ